MRLDGGSVAVAAGVGLRVGMWLGVRVGMTLGGGSVSVTVVAAGVMRWGLRCGGWVSVAAVGVGVRVGMWCGGWVTVAAALVMIGNPGNRRNVGLYNIVHVLLGTMIERLWGMVQGRFKTIRNGVKIDIRDSSSGLWYWHASFSTTCRPFPEGVSRSNPAQQGRHSPWAN